MLKGQKKFFIRNLRAFRIYFLQVLKIRIWGHLLFAGIACEIYLLMPSNFDEKILFDYDWFCPLKMMAFINLKALPSANTFHCFLREITVYFSDEVFSLRFRGYFKQQCTKTWYRWLQTLFLLLHLVEAWCVRVKSISTHSVCWRGISKQKKIWKKFT